MGFYKLTPILLVFSNVLLVSLASTFSENTYPSDPITAQNFQSETGLTAASSVPQSYKIQTLQPRSSASTESRKYGYPYSIAPTLMPVINSRSDDNEENEATVRFSQVKPLGSKFGLSGGILKKGPLKKYKSPLGYVATRRLGYDDEAETALEKRWRSYREPTYRNFDELESTFRPRRIDISEPYSEYEYSPKSLRRPVVSPRDPYLSPSDEPTDTFYPTVSKIKSYSSSYTPRDQDIPIYGAGRYEDSHPYRDDYDHGDYMKSSYDEPPKYPSTGSHYNYQEDYAIESNKPIVGDIRKRLLDYAGASDLYEGEPDYLQEVTRNKQKYGHVANDYYAYGGPAYKSSYRDFPYVESKVSLVKKMRS